MVKRKRTDKGRPFVGDLRCTVQRKVRPHPWLSRTVPHNWVFDEEGPTRGGGNRSKLKFRPGEREKLEAFGKFGFCYPHDRDAVSPLPKSDTKSH